MSKPEFASLTPVLCVSDLAASLVHYENGLGFKRLWQWSSERAFDEPARPTFACVARGECGIFLCEKGQGTPGAWICLNVCTLAELDALHAEYQVSGTDVVEPPHDCSWGMREMLVRDPDGNTFRMGAELGE